MPKQIQGSQTDFSFGEVDVALKRNDTHPARKAGLRQASNSRILNSGAIQNRPGRTALFLETGRVEPVLMSPGNKFYLVFGTGHLRVYNAAGAQVFSTSVKGDGATAIPWASPNLGQITYAIDQTAIYIAYAAGAPANVPQILSWDGVSQTSAWTLSTYAETVISGQKRTPFYRFAPPNIQMLPSAQAGSINITFSGPVLSAGMVGTRLSFCGQQVSITGVTDAEHGTANCAETLPPSQELAFGSDPASFFAVGDEVIGATSGSKGIVTAVDNVANSIQVQLLPPSVGFTLELAVGPSSGLKVTAANTLGPASVSIWNQEVMNIYQGYPSSVAFDQGRLVFSNFPSLQGGIGWSAIGLPSDFWVDPVDAVPSTASAIFEIVPGKSQVLYIVPGMGSSEFVFCDNAIYYIPITPQAPLVPGSVGFSLLSNEGCQPNVQPRSTEQCILYMKAGGSTVGAVQAPGAYNRPYIVDNVSHFHSHLFTASPAVAIAVPSTASQFEEYYAYVLLANGSIVMSKYAMRHGLLEADEHGNPKMGWLPWSGAGTVNWISALGSAVVFSTSYAPNGIAASVVEALDNTQYLDCAISVNALPTPFAAPAGKGPLWWLASGSVTLMDQGTRAMGTYQIDVNGFIVPQNNGGENLAIASLVAGQPWTGITEPFTPDEPSGPNMHQRMLPRRLSYLAVNVINSTGFALAKLFSSKLTPTSPALGAIVNTRRVPAWNQGDDATKPPPLRETVEEWRPSGYSYDPRVAIIKDTPGPLTIAEIGMEISI